MRNPPRRGGDGGQHEPFDIDWSKIDFSTFGRRRSSQPPSGIVVIFAVLLFLFVLIPLVVGPLIGFFTDLQWFRTLGLESVYLLRYQAGFWAFLGSFLVFYLFGAINLYFALRPRVRAAVVVQGRRPMGALALTLKLLPVVAVPALFFGLAGAGEWDTILRYRNAVPFGVTDPVFGRDIGFYFFQLPLLEFVRGWLLAALVVVAIGVAVVYSSRGIAGVALGTIQTPTDLRQVGSLARTFADPARVHLSILAALFLALLSAGYVLDQFGLLFRQEPVLTGAGYTSINARLPGLTILAVIVGIAAVLALANAFARTIWLLVGALGTWVVAAILLLGVYPGIVQTFVVNPDQITRERPYLERHIQATRAAYGLANIDESAFNVATQPQPSELQAYLDPSTTVRLWDYRPLLDAYQQLQGLRQQYAFEDVDVDRYQLTGAERTVMLSARELDVTRLPSEARTWQNVHLVYTHGYGAVLTPVNAVTSEGLPSFSLSDMPPMGSPAITRPQIYYGQQVPNYVVIGTTQDEFDGADKSSRYAGGGGVGVGTLWDRILFAVRFGDGNLLWTPQLQPDSRVLFHRDITERARLIAPFLTFDADPYLVIADGQMYWIQDAYTTGDGYPYSVFRGSFNYIRNSVKVVTNAYDGSVTFYVADPTDPIIRTLRNIYPQLFSKTLDDMPPSLRAHVRYPEDMFRIQVDVFSTFHMTDPQEFYSRGDAWRVANELLAQGGAKTPVQPYYVTTTLPGSTQNEFVLFEPMTPAAGDRDNMVAWIAGRSDGAGYGKLRVLTFPRDRVIYGPLQIDARIDADSSIRQQLNLLSVGSGNTSVIRGNLLVLPAGNSFLYVEPIFVQGGEGRIPELRRVIVATQDRVVMQDTFAKALTDVFTQTISGAPPAPPPPGASASPAPSASPGTKPSGTPSPAPAGAQTVAQLVKQASDQFDAAQAALRGGDFAEYGRQIAQLQDTLGKLRAATGQ
ncbi:MAG: UPF0182 family protein [Chloroflexota bacterium]|nr:UPF0182 family protein [Chloroflexota bacterium]MDE3193179.1 UPF0182 family protein [Chloroflexota bacterium]